MSVQRRARFIGLMFHESRPRFPSEIQAREVGVLYIEQIHPAEALEVVVKPAIVCHESVEFAFTRVPKGSMPDVVRKGDGLG